MVLRPEAAFSHGIFVPRIEWTPMQLINGTIFTNGHSPMGQSSDQPCHRSRTFQIHGSLYKTEMMVYSEDYQKLAHTVLYEHSHGGSSSEWWQNRLSCISKSSTAFITIQVQVTKGQYSNTRSLHPNQYILIRQVHLWIGSWAIQPSQSIKSNQLIGRSTQRHKMSIFDLHWVGGHLPPNIIC